MIEETLWEIFMHSVIFSSMVLLFLIVPTGFLFCFFFFGIILTIAEIISLVLKNGKRKTRST